MLILPILTLFSWIVFTKPDKESRTALESKSCSTNEDCRNLADCIYFSKCLMNSTRCATNRQCVGYGSLVKCEDKSNKCIIRERDLKCYANADCDKYFKCKESKCIANDPECSNSNNYCSSLEHCIDYECEL